MEAIRQIVRIPRNHEIKIKVPDYFADDELMEVILIARTKKQDFKDKIKEMKKAVKDPMYLEDIKTVNRDFAHIDAEGWE